MNSLRQNVVIVTSDSLRADHCGFVSEDGELTQPLDVLGGTGTTFQAATAPGPRKVISVPEFLTGQPMARYDAETDEERMAAMRDQIERHGTTQRRSPRRGTQRRCSRRTCGRARRLVSATPSRRSSVSTRTTSRRSFTS